MTTVLSYQVMELTDGQILALESVSADRRCLILVLDGSLRQQCITPPLLLTDASTELRALGRARCCVLDVNERPLREPGTLAADDRLLAEVLLARAASSKGSGIGIYAAAIVSLLHEAARTDTPTAGNDLCLAPLLAAIQEDPACDWQTTAMAQRVGLSISQFRRRFQTACQMSPQQFVHAQRLKQAAEQLLESDASIAHIAQSCGYHSTSSFTRQFRTFFGTSPSDWRVRRNGA